MKSFLQSFAGALLAIGLVVLIAALYAGSKLDDTPKVEKESWLVLDIAPGLLEYDPPSTFPYNLSGEGPTLQRLLTNLEKARVDKRIKGVILRLYGSGNGWANRQEIRSAIESFKSSGKPIFAYGEWMTDGHYYIATACDSIFLLPDGYLVTTGLMLDRFYVTGTLEKLGIHPNLHRIENYKSAAEMVTRKEMSPEAREMTTWLMNDVYADYVSTVARDRGMSETEFEDVMNAGGMNPADAQERGLVDVACGYLELLDRLKGEEDEERPRTISGGSYAKIKPTDVGLKGKKKIVVVHAQGMIAGRYSRIDPMLGIMMGSETISKQLLGAMRNDDVAAVILRLDSPGGVSMTSDVIGLAVEAVAAEKPMIVSMVNVGASGGYTVSYRASAIVANPSTITGSIGSITGKFNLRGFYDKIGVTKDYVSLGEFATAYWDYSDWTEREYERVRKEHWKSYNRWIEDIAKNRDRSIDEIDAVARGRVWTGRQAIENGLVDALGGLAKAVELAKEMAEIPADEKVTLIHTPKPKSLLESLTGGGFSIEVEGDATHAGYGAWLRGPGLGGAGLGTGAPGHFGPQGAFFGRAQVGGWDPLFLASWARGWLEEYGDRPIEIRYMPYRFH